MHAYIAEPLAPPEPETPAPTKKKRNKLETALVVIAAVLALTLIGTAVKMWTDKSTINELNTSLSNLKTVAAAQEEDINGLETELSASESVNDNLKGQLTEASDTIADYLTCTNGLLKAVGALNNGGLFGSYTALNAIRNVKGECAYALKHSQIAKDHFV